MGIDFFNTLGTWLQVQHEIDTIPVDVVSTAALSGQATGSVVFEAVGMSSWREAANQAPDEWCDCFSFALQLNLQTSNADRAIFKLLFTENCSTPLPHK